MAVAMAWNVTYNSAVKIQNQLQLGIIHNENGNMVPSNERERTTGTAENEDEDHIDREESKEAWEGV